MEARNIQVGCYGKLPQCGDFINRNLAAGFVAFWDEWLQQFIVGSQEQLGEQWLDVYLTSPIWRFVLSAGVADGNIWVGVVMPSVDQVGRYFPFSVLARLPSDANPVAFLATQEQWFDVVEECLLLALDAQLEVDALMERLKGIEVDMTSVYCKANINAEAIGFHLDLDGEGRWPASSQMYILDTLLAKAYTNYSLWSTRGSDRLSACVVGVQGLPALSKLPSLLDGEWSERGWNQRYVVKSR